MIRIPEGILKFSVPAGSPVPLILILVSNGQGIDDKAKPGTVSNSDSHLS